MVRRRRTCGLTLPNLFELLYNTGSNSVIPGPQPGYEAGRMYDSTGGTRCVGWLCASLVEVQLEKAQCGQTSWSGTADGESL